MHKGGSPDRPDRLTDGNMLCLARLMAYMLDTEPPAGQSEPVALRNNAINRPYQYTT